MSSIQDTNKAVARRFVTDVFNSGNAEAYDALVADDYVMHNPPIPSLPGTKAGFFEAVRLTRQAFPDVHVDIEDVIAENDRVMFRDTTRATHRGDFQGIPATDRQLQWTEMHFFRVRDGQVVEHWANFDQLGILMQMGAVPVPA